MYHNSVMLNEAIEALALHPGGVYVDATYGGGGHTRAILAHLQGGRVIAFDQDLDALSNQIGDERLIMVDHNFRFLKNFLRLHEVIPVDGILADLGISSWQIDEPGRGFSIRHDGPLDMRMDRRKGLTAAEVVNHYSAEKLTRIFRDYGEIQNARRLVMVIEEQRNAGPIETTGGLKQTAIQCAPGGSENQYLAQVFQALRIEVNHELDALSEFLTQCTGVLKSGGRLVVISYHSLEDRLIKNFMRSGNLDGEIRKDFYGHQITDWKLITRKAVMASAEETGTNSRARSARLRIAEKI